MKRWLQILLSILAIIIPATVFGLTCAGAYLLNWNLVAFWWSWFGLVWLIDLTIGCYIFYKKNRTDETKTFWLFMIVILPIIGALWALIHNYKLQTRYFEIDNDHTTLQTHIFRARQSIKIYSDSFFVSLDTFKALNYACWKGVNIQLVITQQPTKLRQELLVYNLRKYLEGRIPVYFTSKPINESFIIIDDKDYLATVKNFNFTNIYADKYLTSGHNASKFFSTWEHDLERSSLYTLENERVNPFKKAKLKLVNIFYCFF